MGNAGFISSTVLLLQRFPDNLIIKARILRLSLVVGRHQLPTKGAGEVSFGTCGHGVERI